MKVDELKEEVEVVMEMMVVEVCEVVEVLEVEAGKEEVLKIVAVFC